MPKGAEHQTVGAAKRPGRRKEARAGRDDSPGKAGAAARRAAGARARAARRGGKEAKHAGGAPPERQRLNAALMQVCLPSYGAGLN